MTTATVRIVDITNGAGDVVARDELSNAESVHRQLRPHMPADYQAVMRRVFAGGGRMSVATRTDRVVGVAVFRMHDNTFHGLHMYVDDLVSDERERSSGIGRALMEHLLGLARAAGCTAYTLDSGTHREQAHKFYFREGMVVKAFHFVKAVGDARPP